MDLRSGLHPTASTSSRASSLAKQEALLRQLYTHNSNWTDTTLTSTTSDQTMHPPAIQPALPSSSSSKHFPSPSPSPFAPKDYPFTGGMSPAVSGNDPSPSHPLQQLLAKGRGGQCMGSSPDPMQPFQFNRTVTLELSNITSVDERDRGDEQDGGFYSPGMLRALGCCEPSPRIRQKKQDRLSATRGALFTRTEVPPSLASPFDSSAPLPSARREESDSTAAAMAALLHSPSPRKFTLLPQSLLSIVPSTQSQRSEDDEYMTAASEEQQTLRCDDVERSNGYDRQIDTAEKRSPQHMTIAPPPAVARDLSQSLSFAQQQQIEQHSSSASSNRRLAATGSPPQPHRHEASLVALPTQCSRSTSETVVLLQTSSWTAAGQWSPSQPNPIETYFPPTQHQFDTSHDVTTATRMNSEKIHHLQNHPSSLAFGFNQVDNRCPLAQPVPSTPPRRKKEPISTNSISQASRTTTVAGRSLFASIPTNSLHYPSGSTKWKELPRGPLHDRQRSSSQKGSEGSASLSSWRTTSTSASSQGGNAQQRRMSGAPQRSRNIDTYL